MCFFVYCIEDSDLVEIVEWFDVLDVVVQYVGILCVQFLFDCLVECVVKLGVGIVFVCVMFYVNMIFVEVQLLYFGDIDIEE